MCLQLPATMAGWKPKVLSAKVAAEAVAQVGCRQSSAGSNNLMVALLRRYGVFAFAVGLPIGKCAACVALGCSRLLPGGKASCRPDINWEHTYRLNA